MIDKVNLKDYYNQYQPKQGKKMTSEEVDFPFAKDDPGVIYEPSARAKKEANRTAHANAQKEQESRRVEKSDYEQKEKTEPAQTSSVFAGIQKVVSAAVSYVKEFFLRIWNGDDVGAANQNAGSQSSEGKIGSEAGAELEKEAGIDIENTVGIGNETEMETRSLTKENLVGDSLEGTKANSKKQQAGAVDIRELLKKRDLVALERFLTEDGAKMPAHSTDLLTTYDKSGKLVALNASDKRKILQGNYDDVKL